MASNDQIDFEPIDFEPIDSEKDQIDFEPIDFEPVVAEISVPVEEDKSYFDKLAEVPSNLVSGVKSLAQQAPEEAARIAQKPGEATKAAAIAASRGASVLGELPTVSSAFEKYVVSPLGDIVTGQDTSEIYNRPVEELAKGQKEYTESLKQDFPVISTVGETAPMLAGTTALAKGVKSALAIPSAMAGISATKSASQEYQKSGDIGRAIEEGLEDAAVSGTIDLATAGIGKGLQGVKSALSNKQKLGETLESIGRKKAVDILGRSDDDLKIAQAELKGTADEIGDTLLKDKVLTRFADRKDVIKGILNKQKEYGEEIGNILKETDDDIAKAVLPDEYVKTDLEYVPSSKIAQTKGTLEEVGTKPFAKPGEYQRRFSDVEELAPDLIEAGETAGTKGLVQSENLDDIVKQIDTAISETEPKILEIDRMRGSTLGRVDPKKVVAEFRSQLGDIDFIDPKVQKVLEKLENSPHMSLQKANDLIRGISKLAKFGQQNAPEAAQQFRQLRGVFNKQADNSLKEANTFLGKTERINKHANASKKYGLYKEATKLWRPSPRSTEGTLDLLANVSTLGLPYLAKKYGTQITATTSSRLGEFLKSDPSKFSQYFGKFAGSVGNALSRGPGAFAAANYVLSTRNPEYKKLIEDFEKEQEEKE